MKPVRKPGLRRLGGGGRAGAGASEVSATAAQSLILYIEDNRDNWEVTELMLRRRFTLEWAQSDTAACKALREHGDSVAAVLMDIELQGSKLSGIELTKLLRGSLPDSEIPEFARGVPVRRDLPIFFVTAYSAKYTERELVAVGGTRMLTKPVNFADLSLALGGVAVSAAPAPEDRPGAARTQDAPIARLLTDNPRFLQRLRSLAEAGLFAPKNFAGDYGTLATSLGQHGAASAALAVSVLEIISKPSDATDFLMSLVVRRAVAAALLAEQVAGIDPYLATAAGFMLDAGLLVRAVHDPAGALEVGMSPAASRTNRERAASEVEHPERLLSVARAWTLPPELEQAVAQHHSETPPAGALARIAWGAERLAAVFETGDVAAVNALALAAGKPLGLMTRSVEEILERIPERVKRVGDALGINLPATTPYRAVLAQANPALTSFARTYRDFENTSRALLEEKNALTQRLEDAKEKITESYKKDMALLNAVQSMFLPHSASVVTPRMEIRGYYRSADDCGGDWWWCDVNGDQVRILVGDVSGHGAGAAMVTGAVASVYRVTSRLLRGSAGDEVLELMHHEIEAIAEGKYHMTMAVLDLDSNGAAVLHSAAAPPLLSLSPEGKVSAQVARGAPLGLGGDEFKVGRTNVDARPGTRIMCFTDGMYEFTTVDGKQAGLQTLRRCLLQTFGMTLDKAVESIAGAIQELQSPDEVQGDDMTFVLIDIKA